MADFLSRLDTHRRAVGAALIVLVLAVSCFLLLYKLGSEPLQDYDEATYAEVTAESLAGHHFLSFQFLHNWYFNKPPLLFWVMDGTRELIPNAEVAARLPSAVSGILLIAAVMLVVFEASGKVYGAACGGAILAATSAFIEPAREARFDILVALFIILSVYAFMRALEDRRWFLWFGAFVGLGVLSKGPIELFAIPAVLAIACIYRRFNWFLDPYFWGAVGVSLLIALPWHIYETIKFGEYFWDIYLGAQVLERIKEPLFITALTNGQYLQYIFQFAAPWAYIFCAGLLATPLIWKKLSTKERSLSVAGIVGVFVVLAVCFITQTKAISYLISLYPFMAITIAMLLLGVSRFHALVIKIVIGILFAGCLLYGLWLSVYNGFHINSYYWYEVELADEEKGIAEALLARHAPQFYIYDTTTLGSIMYYSRLVTPGYLSADTPYGSYLLFNTNELQKLESAYPQLHLLPVYQGTYLSLAELN